VVCVDFVDTRNKMSSVVFYYDIVCPYSYIASKKLPLLSKNIQITWRPVLLGGIYKSIQAPQGKNGSASDVMPAAKQTIFAKDMRRQLFRYNIPFEWNPLHPIKTLKAQRLLTGISDHNERIKLSQKLFHYYWVQRKDLSEDNILIEAAKECGVKIDHSWLKEFPEQVKEALSRNTDEVVDRGAPGVPAFWVERTKKLYWGADRMHFVDFDAGNKDSKMPRFFTKPNSQKPHLKFFYDFSSPWSYIGSTQVERIAKETNAELEYVPILLGALFREIGTPNLPMENQSEAKRKWSAQDMEDWKKWWGIHLQWPSQFPIRTVNPLRVAIVEPKVIPILYKAAWVDDQNIGENAVLKLVLTKAGFDADYLLKQAEEATIKDKLKQNTEEAIKSGVCGVPSFQVNGGDIIWGQDRLDIVADLLCGWKCPEIVVGQSAQPGNAKSNL